MICPVCKKEVNSLVGRLQDDTINYSCKTCTISYKPLHSLKNCDNFTPHYDTQLGQFFDSKESKKDFMTKQGLYQVSGTDSPRKTEGVGRLVCTRSQYRDKRNIL
jgi:hypothetical protein